MYKSFHFGNLGAFTGGRLILAAGSMALASFVAGSFSKLDIEEFKVFAWSGSDIHSCAAGKGTVPNTEGSIYDSCVEQASASDAIVNPRGLPEQPQTSATNLKDGALGAEPEVVPDDLVKLTQLLLTELGYAPGPVDGLAGPRTVTTVKQYQLDQQLEPTGQITQELGLLLQLELSGDRRKNDGPSSAGSGIMVSREGYVLTSYHVVEDCEALAIAGRLESAELELVATDSENDLAVLKTAFLPSSAAVFSSEKTATLGQMVATAGFALRSVLGEDLKVTFGEVNALSGIESDRRDLLVSTPIQPGNSGGPLLDESGLVIGVINSSLDAEYMLEEYGDIPQNVNFALKGAIAKSFLDINNIEYQEAESGGTLNNVELARLAESFTIPIDCY